MEKNILLTIEYDGSQFHGWQKQPDRRTVQGYLECILSDILGSRISLNGTSRTDAGVHAYGQRASFKADVRIPTERLAAVVNNTLKRRAGNPLGLPSVRIVSAEEMLEDFHARFDAKGKKYIYRIDNSTKPDIFTRNYVYHVAQPLDIQAMNRGAELIKGKHDFKAFESSGGNPRKTTVRTIFDISVCVAFGGSSIGYGSCESSHIRCDSAGESLGGSPVPAGRSFAGGLPAAPTDTENEKRRCSDLIEIHVAGDGFLYNMVRIITGTLVEVGKGKIPPEEVKDIVESCDRRKAGHTAPPQGLYLAEIYY